MRTSQLLKIQYVFGQNVLTEVHSRIDLPDQICAPASNMNVAMHDCNLGTLPYLRARTRHAAAGCMRASAWRARGRRRVELVRPCGQSATVRSVQRRAQLAPCVAWLME